MVNPALMTVQWNLRKCVKELLLLEEHLSDPEQRCPDCIWKHLLKAEAWLDEAATLDNRKEYTTLLRNAQGQLRSVQAIVTSDLRAANISSRVLRKNLQPFVV